MLRAVSQYRAAIIIGIATSLAASLILAALKAVLGLVEGLTPWVLIAALSVLIGVATAMLAVRLRPPTTLRRAVFKTAWRMRRFADDVDGRPKSYELPRDFWERFPFKSYDRLQARMQVRLGPNSIIPVSQFLPNATSVIRNIAMTLEREALQIPEDMLL